MEQSGNNAQHIGYLSAFSVLLTVFLLVAPVSIYSYSAINHLDHTLQLQSNLIQRVLTSPGWIRQDPKDNSRQLFDMLDLDADTHVQIRTLDGQLLFENSSILPRTPRSSNTRQIDDQGRTLVLQLTLSQRPVVYIALSIFLVSGIFAGFILYYVGWLPRVVMLHHHKTIDRLEEQLSRSEQDRINAIQKADFNFQALQHLASHDALTDLPNRGSLEQSIQQAIISAMGRGNMFALLVLDLQNLKEINDTLGHQNGDLILQAVSHRLQNMQPGFQSVARLGGDEFAILTVNAGSADAVLRQARQILETIEKPIVSGGYKLDTSAAIGIALYPDHGNTVEMLIRHADVAMYVAKASKQKLVTYREEIDPNSVSNLTLRGELRAAISNQDLEVHYQPKINLHSMELTSAEALIRWAHKERGNITPSNFIPIAEQTGLIHPMTELLINHSIKHFRHYIPSSHELGLALNLSVRSLNDTQLVHKIRQVLEKNNTRGDSITMEITESAILQDPQGAKQTLSQLADLGINIAIDDYGTGYSSLSYIKQLPIHEIKIDKSFVMDMTHNENDNIIVRATIDMAHDLGLKVTAEGVENIATWNKLIEYGCDYAQGFYISRALSGKELRQWLKQAPWKIRSSLKLINQLDSDDLRR